MTRKTWFEKLDTNSDGTLSKQEIMLTGLFAHTTISYFKNLLPLEEICTDIWSEIEKKSIMNRTRRQ